MIGYLNGEYLPLEDMRISPFDRANLFGDAIYEVIRSYDGRLFEVPRHMRRLERGARELLLPCTEFPKLPEVAAELIRLNDLNATDALVYIQVSRGTPLLSSGAAPRSHAFPSPDTPLSIWAYVRAFERDIEGQTHGVHAILVPDQRWGRCDIKTVSLIPNTMAYEQAQSSGAHEALFVRDGLLMEGSHTSMLTLRDGVVEAPPRSPQILDGVTRYVVEDICSDLHIPVTECDIPQSGIWDVDEMFLTGTASEVLPVVRVDGKPIGDGTPGAVTRAIQKAFRVRSLHSRPLGRS
jgi:D-alanine transaminase